MALFGRLIGPLLGCHISLSLTLGIEPLCSESQCEHLKQFTPLTDPVAAYLQLLSNTREHPLAHIKCDLTYLITRWPELPQHIHQAILTLVRSVERQSDGAVKNPEHSSTAWPQS